MNTESIPTLDFRRIPRELAGLWVVLRLGDDQEIVAQAETPLEAMRLSKIDPDDPRFVLTQVPDDRPGAAWVTHLDRPDISR